MKALEKVKRLNFPANQYVVVCGAVLAAHGIRDTEDLDILVRPELFKKCKEEGWMVTPWTKAGKKGKDWLAKNGIELYEELIMVGDSIFVEDLAKNDIEIIEGVPLLSLTRLMEFKKEYLRLYNRPKDIKDISLIEAYLRQK